MILSSAHEKQKGFTLLELMIAILIGALVVAATLTIYVTTIRGSSNTIKLTRLNQDIGVTMLIMTNDIRRAGYWGGAVVGANLTTNPFSELEVRDMGATGLQDPTVVPPPDPPVTGNCITYSYDANAYEAATYDPAVDSVTPDANEYFGFRLNDDAVQIKTSGATSTDPQCNDGTWVNLTDPDEIKITDLVFTLIAENQANNVSGNNVVARRVSIQIEAEMVSDPSIALKVKLDEDDDDVPNDVVKIRNNLVEP